MHFFGVLLVTTYIAVATIKADKSNGLQVIYAVNAGGYDHIGKHSIHYKSDPLDVGTASDYGKHLLFIGRVSDQDEALYRTERYHTANFGYDLPLEGDGNYALVLKFCEVYFNEPNKKVFNVVLNRKHEVVTDLDIFAQVGRGAAHHEYVYFTVRGGKLHFNGEVSEIRNNIVRLEFIKGSLDNPKINAFVLFKGDIERVPKLSPLHTESNPRTEAPEQAVTERIPVTSTSSPRRSISVDEEDDMDTLFTDNRKQSKTSGPRQPNPYTMNDSMVLMPVFIAIGCFIPLLFCLCKL